MRMIGGRATAQRALSLDPANSTARQILLAPP